MAFPYVPQTWTDGSGGGTPVSAARLTVMENAINLAGVEGIGSTPPSSPTDGMIWRLPAASGSGIYWFFMYDSSQTTNKWVSMGIGPPMNATVTTSETSASTTYVDLATAGPSITVPRAGDYILTFGSQTQNSGAGNFTAVSPKLGAAATSDNNWAVTPNSTAVVAGVMTRSIAAVALAASDVVKLQYRTGAGTGTWANRWLQITPIRII